MSHDLARLEGHGGGGPGEPLVLQDITWPQAVADAFIGVANSVKWLVGWGRTQTYKEERWQLNYEVVLEGLQKNPHLTQLLQAFVNHFTQLNKNVGYLGAEQKAQLEKFNDAVLGMLDQKPYPVMVAMLVMIKQTYPETWFREGAALRGLIELRPHTFLTGLYQLARQFDDLGEQEKRFFIEFMFFMNKTNNLADLKVFSHYLLQSASGTQVADTQPVVSTEEEVMAGLQILHQVGGTPAVKNAVWQRLLEVDVDGRDAGLVREFQLRTLQFNPLELVCTLWPVIHYTHAAVTAEAPQQTSLADILQEVWQRHVATVVARLNRHTEAIAGREVENHYLEEQAEVNRSATEHALEDKSVDSLTLNQSPESEQVPVDTIAGRLAVYVLLNQVPFFKDPILQHRFVAMLRDGCDHIDLGWIQNATDLLRKVACGGGFAFSALFPKKMGTHKANVALGKEASGFLANCQRLWSEGFDSLPDVQQLMNEKLQQVQHAAALPKNLYQLIQMAYRLKQAADQLHESPFAKSATQFTELYAIQSGGSDIETLQSIQAWLEDDTVSKLMKQAVTLAVDKLKEKLTAKNLLGAVSDHLIAPRAMDAIIYSSILPVMMLAGPVAGPMAAAVSLGAISQTKPYKETKQDFKEFLNQAIDNIVSLPGVGTGLAAVGGAAAALGNYTVQRTTGVDVSAWDVGSKVDETMTAITTYLAQQIEQSKHLNAQRDRYYSHFSKLKAGYQATRPLALSDLEHAVAAIDGGDVISVLVQDSSDQLAITDAPVDKEGQQAAAAAQARAEEEARRAAAVAEAERAREEAAAQAEKTRLAAEAAAKVLAEEEARRAAAEAAEKSRIAAAEAAAKAEQEQAAAAQARVEEAAAAERAREEAAAQAEEARRVAAANFKQNLSLRCFEACFLRNRLNRIEMTADQSELVYMTRVMRALVRGFNGKSFGLTPVVKRSLNQLCLSENEDLSALAKAGFVLATMDCVIASLERRVSKIKDATKKQIGSEKVINLRTIYNEACNNSNLLQLGSNRDKFQRAANQVRSLGTSFASTRSGRLFKRAMKKFDDFVARQSSKSR